MLRRFTPLMRRRVEPYMRLIDIDYDAAFCFDCRHVMPFCAMLLMPLCLLPWRHAICHILP